MSFKPGFMAPPWPHTPGDSVSAKSLIARIEKEANRTCGCYYEIYHYRVIRELTTLLDAISAEDATTLRQAASDDGFDLDESALQHAHRAYTATLSEIRENEE